MIFISEEEKMLAASNHTGKVPEKLNNHPLKKFIRAREECLRSTKKNEAFGVQFSKYLENHLSFH